MTDIVLLKKNDLFLNIKIFILSKNFKTDFFYQYFLLPFNLYEIGSRK